MTQSQRTAAARKAWATIRSKRANPPKPKKKIKLPPQEPIKLPKDPRFASAEQMMARTVVMILTINATGNRRKLNPAMLDVTDAKDQAWIGVTKKLMQAEELDEITSLNNKTRQYVESRALPSQIKRGVYLLPVDFVEEVNGRLTQDMNILKPLVEKLVDRLPEYKAEAKKQQSRMKVGDETRNLWNEEQFPTGDELRAAFRLSWRFLYVDSAKNLEAVSKEIYEEEKKKAEASWIETRETIQQLLRTHLSEMVNHMIEKLTPEPDGRCRIFRESSIGKLNEFLATFDTRNITNDVQMKVLVDKAKTLVKGADAETLRTNEELREYVRHGFTTIKTLLDPMVAIKPRRTITFDDTI